MSREFRVGVFERQGRRKVRLDAYTTWFSPSWDGCCIHTVKAVNGTRAKQIAMAEHRAQHMSSDVAQSGEVTREELPANPDHPTSASVPSVESGRSTKQEQEEERAARGGKPAAVGHGDLPHRKTGDSSAPA